MAQIDYIIKHVGKSPAMGNLCRCANCCGAKLKQMSDAFLSCKLSSRSRSRFAFARCCCSCFLPGKFFVNNTHTPHCTCCNGCGMERGAKGKTERGGRSIGRQQKGTNYFSNLIKSLCACNFLVPCVCVCVSYAKKADRRTSVHTHTLTHIYSIPYLTYTHPHSPAT